jgi:methyl-accepting chemotaxis protein
MPETKKRIDFGYKILLGFLIVIITGILVPYIVRAFKLGEIPEMLTSVFGALFVGGFISLYLSRSFTRDLKLISSAAEQISNGDLTKEVGIIEKKYVDEMVDFAESLEKMRYNLRVLVNRIKDTALKVSDASGALSTTVQGITSSVNEVARTVEQIAKGASQQAELVERSSRIIKENSQSLKDNAKKAANATESGTATLNITRDGENTVKLAVERMINVFELVKKSGSDVISFSDKLGEIKKIVELITNIAQKTNILAINAAIEAARAGEHGKGFVVVADEVRRLADASQKAGEQISQIVAEIDEGNKSTSSAIKESLRNMEQARTFLESMLKTFNTIRVHVEGVAQMSRAVSESSLSQVAKSEELVHAIDEILKVAEENAAATEEVSAATQEQTASMNDLTTSAENLKQVSDELKTLVEKFRLEQ